MLGRLLPSVAYSCYNHNVKAGQQAPYSKPCQWGGRLLPRTLQVPEKQFAMKKMGYLYQLVLWELVENGELIKGFGQRSYEIAMEKYDVHKVNQFMLNELGVF